MTQNDVLWLAGLLEGEGSFYTPASEPRRPRITVEMTDEDVVQRVADLFGVSVQRRQARRVGWKSTFRAQLRGTPAVRLMRKLQPQMGIRRSKQIETICSVYVERRPGDNSRKLTLANVHTIRTSVASVSELARTFCVSRTAVRAVRARKSWRSV